MKIGLPHTLSKHCSSTNLIVGTKSKEMREHRELFTYNLLEALVPSHHPFCSPPETHIGLQPTFTPYIRLYQNSPRKLTVLPEVFAVLKNDT